MSNEGPASRSEDIPFWVKSHRAANAKGDFSLYKPARKQYIYMMSRLAFGQLDSDGQLIDCERSLTIEKKIHNLPFSLSRLVGWLLWRMAIGRVAFIVFRDHLRKFKKDVRVMVATWPSNPKLYS
jgi:hypothetical protein